MITALLLAAATPSAAHPRWMVGDWCYPAGRPLRLRQGDAFDGDEVTTYRANGRWSDELEGGRWRIEGNRLIEQRTVVEPDALGTGERVRATWVTRFVRHGRYAMAMTGQRRGWAVRCPW